MFPDKTLFETTRWSTVIQAAGSESTEARAALDLLCRIYWKPLYVYLRQRGYTNHDAEDLTQDFLAYLLSHHALSTVNPRKGKFRGFLLASLKNFLANQWDRARAQKRGGGRVWVPLDDPEVERLYSLERADQMSPDKMFERHWALTVLRHVRAKLRVEYAAAGKLKRFNRLVSFLPGEQCQTTQAEAAKTLQLTEGAFKVEVHRLRRRFAEQLRQEISRTVTRPEEIDEELRYLIEVLNGS
jgi:RNA polymerase sigma-70 factor (ECF subfamily)